MIITTSKKIKSSLGKNKILVIDDINTANKEEVFEIIDNCDVYIESKFSIPTTSNEIITERSKVISKMNELFTALNDSMNKGSSKLFSTNTQIRNFKIKVLYWCTNDFSNTVKKLDNNEESIVVINHELSKHEKLFVKALADCGATILLICNNFNYNELCDEIGSYAEGQTTTSEEIKFGTSEHIKYDSTNKIKSKGDNNSNELECVNVNNYNSLDELETALYENNETVKVNVSGMNNYIDTCNFYAKLYNYCMNNNDWVLANNGFAKPTYEQTSAIPRFANTKHDYIIVTLLQFLNLGSNEDNEEVSNIIRNLINNNENKDLSGQILYNKIIYVICVLNTLYSTGKPKCIVFYGGACKNDELILEVLSRVRNLSVIVACSDKNKSSNIVGLSKLELGISNEIFPIPLVDKRDGASTLAAQAERRVNETLFSGDTLGMYKPGQFRSCKTINFNTTFDEIKLWWNKDIYLRPGFEAQGNIAVVPVMFRIIKGCLGDNITYINEVQKYCCGKTILCRDRIELGMLAEEGTHFIIHRGTDINGTKFEDQKQFFENGKLNKQRIKSGKNYHYSFLDMNKQDMILDKIEELLTSKKINKQFFNNEQEYIDMVLNIGLNLHMSILQNIQWFEFYTYNPNMIVIFKDQEMPKVNDMILLALLQSLGFDILVFVPTCYSSIENLCGPEFVYDTNIIGEANYNVRTESLHVTNNIEIQEVVKQEQPKKQGFFSRLFGK